MSSKTTFAEISPSEYRTLYEGGMSIDEIATKAGRSYTFVRTRLIESGVVLRTKADGTRAYVAHHPEWSKQFVKYEVTDGGRLFEEKALLLAMVVTEGYTDATSFGFTNTQEMLHADFGKLVDEVYGHVRIGRNGITSRVSSIAIAQDLSRLLPAKAFSNDVLRFIIGSPTTLVKVLRIIANTEGAMIIAIKRAKHNFTVESRIVLASSNLGFTKQIGILLASLGVECRISKVGVVINKKSQIAHFIEMVGFSPGVRVVRKKAGESIWYGFEKRGLQKLFLRISEEQEHARASGLRGCFADCSTKELTKQRLQNWYAEVNGGGSN
ncbi:MAG: helix-turn-helix domain-containing protein [Thaumarchaeota archaeon]|nr:helix-turn-helix domain-containing protein [Nitrososphaerota archaeon]